MARLDYHTGRALCAAFGINPEWDYHQLPSAMVDAVIRAADSVKYRKPQNANGSRGRYFFEYLRRVIERGPK